MPDDPQLESLKLPPHSLEAEQSILGGLLLDNEAADRIGDVLSEDDFYSDAHRVIYRHIVALGGEGKPVDVVTLSETLGSVQKLDYVGGLAYLGALVQNVPTSANIRHYAAIVRERSILRQLAATAGEIADSAYNPLGRSAKSVLDEAEAKVLHIAEQGTRGQRTFALLKDLLAGVVDRIEMLYNRDDPSDVTGVATGYTDLDRMTSGLQPGDLVIVAGRPSMGKSSLAINIGEHVALELKMPVVVFSMEMGASQLAMRMIGSVGKLDQHKLRTGRLGPDDWERLSSALGRLSEAPILIDETPALNAIEVRSRARRLQKQYGQLGLVIVDYIQLMQAQSAGREPRHRDLRDLAVAKVPREGTQGAGDGAVAAEPLARAAAEQASGDVGPARVRDGRYAGRHCRRYPAADSRAGRPSPDGRGDRRRAEAGHRPGGGRLVERRQADLPRVVGERPHPARDRGASTARRPRLAACFASSRPERALRLHDTHLHLRNPSRGRMKSSSSLARWWAMEAT